MARNEVDGARLEGLEARPVRCLAVRSGALLGPGSERILVFANLAQGNTRNGRWGRRFWAACNLGSSLSV